MIGYAILKLHSDAHCEIYSLGVFPEFHSRGISSRLFSEIEHFCFQNHLRLLKGP
ncbi:MAG: hypothetical protein CVV64_19230 [Candidatus Wallbacteria bacterium HGW-Wallbacteria-1]|uniref:N-acetyltransferase domain-containing protein n=1 Tax=Candidatus Wallbacteria bacterium HGW-Wallbacteria-1 TaxID=2013854 RepID=A0A2N1PJA1_9BACT|nr:MAG: hypothetical protein CVV64_19230 [Candidatus Wallbacteria bacterium HGW-Wallbacteria-1]